MNHVESHAASVSSGLISSTRHALAWLIAGNAIGVMLAILLVFPKLNLYLGEWTYGRWMMVHMNVLLFGWCSLPMVGFLFKVYGADSGDLAPWCRPVVWLWSAGLLAGSYSWLSGESSGKLFLDWSGFSRVFFPLALLGLWLLLTMAFLRSARATQRKDWAALAAKATGLLVLLAVPFTIYIASSPDVYPLINPDTGGPTGQSQLESSLGVVLILLALPFGLTRKKPNAPRIVLPLCWLVFLFESVLCAAMGRADVSHRALSQWLSLGILLVWVPLMPAYYAAFAWHNATRRWRVAFLWWWTGLVITGWVFFLPGVLDRFKFTDGLVGHSLTAVAGCLTAFVIFVLIQLLEDQGGWLFNRAWSFYAWNLGVLAYVVLMTVTGWIEGANPEFTIVPAVPRDMAYCFRILTGVAMLAGSLEWLIAALRKANAQPQHQIAGTAAEVV